MNRTWWWEVKAMRICYRQAKRSQTYLHFSFFFFFLPNLQHSPDFISFGELLRLFCWSSTHSVEKSALSLRLPCDIFSKISSRENSHKLTVKIQHMNVASLCHGSIMVCQQLCLIQPNSVFNSDTFISVRGKKCLKGLLPFCWVFFLCVCESDSYFLCGFLLLCC